MASGIFFTKEFWPTIGGIGEHSHQMAKHLTELGENITLLHYVPEGYQGDDEFDRTCGYPVVRFSTNGGTGRWYRNSWARRVLVTTLLKEGRRIDADYLVYNGWGGSSFFEASLALGARVLGIPSFLFIHSRRGVPKRRSRLHGYASKTLLRSAAGVITVCHSNMSFLREFKLRQERLHVIYNGVDLRESDRYLRLRKLGRFSRLDAALPIGEPNILCVARLNTIKRIDRLIRAMPRILASVPNARLAIAGIGDEEEQLRQLISDSPRQELDVLVGTGHGRREVRMLRSLCRFCLAFRR